MVPRFILTSERTEHIMTESAIMRSVRLIEPGRPFSLRAVSIPTPGEGEALVRINACGVCRTDLHIRDGLLDLGKRNFAVGHEIAGTVTRCGAGAPATWLGRRAAIYYYEGCGLCRYCLTGDEHLCPTPRAQPGFNADGGFAEYICVPVRNCVPLPDHVSTAEAAIMGCAGSTAVHAGRLATIRPGEWVVVYGTGGVGLALLQYARNAGARVIAIGRGGARESLAREHGTEYTIDVTHETDVAARVREITGEGADIVFELVGTATSIRSGMDMLRRRGRLVLIGYTQDTFQTHPIDLIVREVSFIGSVGATLSDLHEAIDLLARGVLRVPVALTLPLEDFETALEQTRKGGLPGRVVLTP
jgi:propanol-preferring alcohol dehydrogenase